MALLYKKKSNPLQSP